MNPITETVRKVTMGQGCSSSATSGARIETIWPTAEDIPIEMGKKREGKLSPLIEKTNTNCIPVENLLMNTQTRMSHPSDGSSRSMNRRGKAESPPKK